MRNSEVVLQMLVHRLELLKGQLKSDGITEASIESVLIEPLDELIELGRGVAPEVG